MEALFVERMVVEDDIHRLSELLTLWALGILNQCDV